MARKGKTEAEIREALAACGNTGLKIDYVSPEDGKVYFKDHNGKTHSKAGSAFVNMCEGYCLIRDSLKTHLSKVG